MPGMETDMRLLGLPLIGLVACGPTGAVHNEDNQGVQVARLEAVQPSGPATQPVGEVSAAAQAPAGPAGESGERGRFVEMSGALTLTIETAAGPLEVRLAEVDTPVPDETRAWLADQLEGRDVQLVYSGLRRDRYDRALAQVLVSRAAAGDDGPTVADWLQYRLVEAGLARVMSHADNQAQAPILLPAEARARRDRRGLWAQPDHHVRDAHPDARAQDVGSAQIVEGRVLEAVRLNSGRLYLNFGTDYRTDFTVRIDAPDSQAFLDAGLTPEAMTGRRVRVRGWLSDENGPMIVIDHPARLELLEEDAASSRAR